MDDDVIDVQELNIKAIIGFDGTPIGGFRVHPDNKHVIYPVGNKVTIQDWKSKKQYFLTGHTNIISAIDVSISGKYIASGQINHLGFKARVIIWDFEKRQLHAQHELHKVRVENLTFTKDDLYLISLGGRDCGSIVVWHVMAGHALCGASASRGTQGDPTVIRATNRRPACFVTGGDNHLVVWIIDHEARNVKSIDVAVPKLRRQVLCMDIDERDELCFCGTTTGDVLKLRLNFHHDSDVLEPVKQPMLIGCFARLSKKKLPRGTVNLYGNGVRSIRRLFGGNIIIGAGDGTVELVEEATPHFTKQEVKLPSTPALRVLRSVKVHSSVTSIDIFQGDILVGTANCEIFKINRQTFSTQLLVTCHTSIIYDIAFPFDFSELFATASKHDVRLWSMENLQELIRIRVPNFMCSTVLFLHSGKGILTGWNDGVIRCWTPLTGRLMYAILNCHNKGVSALAETTNGQMLVSGGCEGQVRLWEITPTYQRLICTLKEHRGPISSIHINNDDTEAVSASTDGSCIIWDLKHRHRRQILFAKTLFMCARYIPSAVQLLTCGSDRKIAYWEVLDGALVRELDGSGSGTVNALDISPDGITFVSAGNDQIVKLWRYQEGITTHIGTGHSAVITAASFSPDGKHIVTCSASGSVFVWECPEEKRAEEYVTKEVSSPKEVKKPASIESLSSRRSIKAGGDGNEEDVRDLPSVRSSRSSKSSKSGDKPNECCPCTCTCEHDSNEKAC